MTEQDRNGEGYVLRRPYLQGAEITYEDQAWVYERRELTEPVPGPREYRHTLSTLMNGLIEQGFVIQHVSDSTDMHPALSAETGTWDHFVTYVHPGWLFGRDTVLLMACNEHPTRRHTSLSSL